MKMTPPKPPRMPSTPMSVRDTRSDTSGKSGNRSPSVKGDKHTKVGGNRSAGSVDKGPKSRTPRGSVANGGVSRTQYHKRG